MGIRFVYCETTRHTSFGKKFKDNSITIYVGTNETRTKEELLEDLKETGLMKEGAN